MQICLNERMTYLKGLGTRIESYAKTVGLTQAALGKLCDISQTQISRIFNGSGDTTTEKLKSICCVLKVSPEDILFAEDEAFDFLYRHNDTNDTLSDANVTAEHSVPQHVQSHEIIKMLSDLNYKLATEHTPPEDLDTIEALLRTCLSSLHRELKNDTASAPAKTA